MSELGTLSRLELAPLPSLPFKPAPGALFNVTRAGVFGDGETVNTAAIQRVINDCAAAGGGTVLFPPGRYLTGTIQIKSHVTLRLEAGAILLGSADVADYANVDPFTDGSGNSMGHALIVAMDAENVGIEGSGIVDGQSPALRGRQLQETEKYAIRPFLLRWIRCADVIVRDVLLTNPGAWTLNFYESRNVLVENVTIRCRALGMHNNDGINLDSSENVRVRNCDVSSGDDALVIKSTNASRLCRNIIASDCRLSTRTNAIKIGTESIGGFENISISNCEITNTKMAGIAMYAVDGGSLRNVSISDIDMDGVVVPISIRLGSRFKTFRAGQKPKTAPGKLRDVVIKNVTARNIEMIGLLINGIPGHPVEAITLKNIDLEVSGGGTPEDAKLKLPELEAGYPEFNTWGLTMPASGIYMRHARDIRLENVRTTVSQPDARPATVFVDVENVKTTTAPLPTQFFKNLLAGKKQTVVVYGTSLSHTAEWPNALKEYLETQFPGQITFVNAALSGRQSHWGIHNLQERVLAHRPDLVFLEFSVNDAATKHNISQEQSASNLDGLVRDMHEQNPQMDIVLQTMNPAWDSPDEPAGKRSSSDRPNLAEYYELYRRYARLFSLPLIDHHQNWLEIQEQDWEKFQQWLPDGCHPIPEASLAVTWPAIREMLDSARRAAKV